MRLDELKGKNAWIIENSAEMIEKGEAAADEERLLLEKKEEAWRFVVTAG